MSARLRIAIGTLASALFAVGACNKADKSAVDTTTAMAPAPATTVPATKPFSVGDIDMGRHVGADKKISDKTDDFAARDTLYASVHTTGGSAPVKLTARWNFQDGKVVKEQTETITGGPDADTDFHIEKASGWPKGKYTLHILTDGTEAKSKEITVK
jgi:hypothetical protein